MRRALHVYTAALTGLEVVAVEERLTPLEEVVQLALDEPSLRCAVLLVVGKKCYERLLRPCEPSGRGGRLLVREERRVVGRVCGSAGVEAEEDGVRLLDPVGDGDKCWALPWVVLPALLDLCAKEGACFSDMVRISTQVDGTLSETERWCVSLLP